MNRILLFLFIALTTTIHAQQVKVACVGNSVTFGYRVENREVNCYPARLQHMLGDGYEVKNFGKSGATLLQKGHRPYNEQEEYKAALAFTADRVIIHLGLNDTDPRNWPNFGDEFIADYLTLIDSFRKVNPACKIWICRMTPIFDNHPRFKSGTRDWYWQIQQAIESIATIGQTGIIDLHDKLSSRPDLFPDALHPTAEGANMLAQVVCQTLTGNYGGLQMPVTYSDNMVLQRGKPLPITGTANAGETITVRIANQQKQARAGENGKWSVTLDPLKAGGPYSLSVSAPSKTCTYSNVLVGEVWVCSGQSNMAFRLSEAIDNEREALLKYAETNPQIRLFDMKPRWETNAVEWDVSALDSLNRLDYYRNTQWQECNRKTASRFSAIAFAFGQMLSDSLQVPVGLILNAIGGSPTEAWIDRKTLEFEFPDILANWLNNDFIQEWARERAAQNIKKSANKQQRHPYQPCYLYEAGIRPLEQYPVRGIIWYQGESNAHNIEAHEKLLRLLTESWRNNWSEELPFYYVQLSSIDRPSWPKFRDSQRRLLQIIPNSGMAVSSDRGDSLNVHPRQKKEVGERLAHWALNKTYGRRTLPSGPLFRSVSFNKDTAYITFEYGVGMHTSDGQPLRTFEIAEHDGLFVPAHAEIVDGKGINVWSEKIKNPKLVRYGWQPFTRANLVNAEGLPASTFYHIKQYEHMKITCTKLPDLPGINGNAPLGVSAPFVGFSNGALLIGGGCNFPGKPVTEGGIKRYYSELFVLDTASAAEWKPAGHLPVPVAYGASATTPEGVVCIGGNNSEQSFRTVFLLKWNGTAIKTVMLPQLPAEMDNLSATAAGSCIYVAGGNEGQKACNTFLVLDLQQGKDAAWIRLPDFPGAARVQPVLAALQTEGKTRIYLAGGFQPLSDNHEAIIPTDMLVYTPDTKTWNKETELPPIAPNSLRTLTGGCAVAYGESSILLMGGVNYNRFLPALNRPLYIRQAEESGQTALADSLREEGKIYLHHPVDWYQFNTSLLHYTPLTGEWKNVGEYEQLARAGAGAVIDGNRLFIANGELKPGIRTPQVNMLSVQMNN